jgi:hypothetical protein
MLKKFRVLLVIASLVVTFCVMSNTYSKYVASSEGNVAMEFARWQLLVNEADITNKTTANFDLNPVIIKNNNVADNKVAPSSEGYFDIEIDGTQADVSFKYEIIAKVNEESAVQDITITGYQINNGEFITEDLESISNIVSAKDTTKNIKVRIFIKWDDSENASMNNEADTNATYSSEAKMDIELKFTQVII